MWRNKVVPHAYVQTETECLMPDLIGAATENLGEKSVRTKLEHRPEVVQNRSITATQTSSKGSGITEPQYKVSRSKFISLKNYCPNTHTQQTSCSTWPQSFLLKLPLLMIDFC